MGWSNKVVELKKKTTTKCLILLLMFRILPRKTDSVLTLP